MLILQNITLLNNFLLCFVLTELSIILNVILKVFSFSFRLLYVKNLMNLKAKRWKSMRKANSLLGKFLIKVGKDIKSASKFRCYNYQQYKKGVNYGALFSFPVISLILHVFLPIISCPSASLQIYIEQIGENVWDNCILYLCMYLAEIFI